MQQDPLLIVIALLQILNAMLVGGVAWYFAYHQRRIAEAKLRLDLFDKRFTVFNATRTFLGRAIVLGKLSVDDENAFLIGRTGASFLFDDELDAYLKEVHKRAVEVSWQLEDAADATSDDAREAAKAKWLAERRWLREQPEAMEARFKRFLQLDG